MTPDKLLDAIGLLDDRHFETNVQTQIVPWRRRLLALAAAVLVLILSVGTAIAVSPEFRGLVFSVFDIETHEQPPAGNGNMLPTENSTDPTKPALQEIDVVNIDGIVNARYFTSEGHVLTYEGGFYTYSRTDGDTIPDDATFWEIQTDAIVDVGATRVDLPLTYGDRTFQIIFDYAVLNGKLSVRVWPQNLNEDPIGNGWNVEPVGSRTDVALLTVPVSTDRDYTHEYFLLNLETEETTELLGQIPHENIIIDACWLTNDMRYGILMGIDKQSSSAGYWFCDLEKSTVVTFNTLTGKTATEPYFLDDSTVIYQESLGEGRLNIVRYHIPTGEQSVVIENTTRRVADSAGYRGIQRNGGKGKHCLLFQEDGSIDLIDLRSSTSLNMTGLNIDKLTTSESPDGTSILIAYEETNENNELGYGYSSLGILNPETGIVKMLTRDVSGIPENFCGWLANDTLVITSYNAGGYYVYVYEFRE